MASKNNKTAAKKNNNNQNVKEEKMSRMRFEHIKIIFF